MPSLRADGARRLDGVGELDVDDLVDHALVEDRGDEVGADALDLVGAGRALGQQRRVRGLDRDDLRAGHALLEHLADAGDRAARADAGDEVVDLAVGVADDLLGGGLAVDLDVRLVLELTGQDRARGLGEDLLGLRDRALHAAGGVGEDELGAVCLQQQPALDGHGGRHGEDDLVSTCRADHREGDAGVAARRLDDRAAGVQLAGCLGGIDDRDAQAILDAGGGVVELELRQNGAADALRDAVEAYQRGVAEGRGDVGMDAGHVGPFAGRRVREQA